ncbi:hypothetical protein [Halovivax limisalsi]|uniref:hypothetical protein n=1 Tax=Halovivax limisalsi TaxID=1453760 RepID=UPI001FFD478E|nr:hypothetical protein [Halovivax limisalsi]
MPTCPYCLRGAVVDGACAACDRSIRTRNGMPSVTAACERDRRVDELRHLAALDVSGSLDPVAEAHRAGRLSTAVVDRFFDRRPIGWRVLLEAALGGRCLVVGAETEAAALALAEVTESLWIADVNPASLEALDAVATATGTALCPLHATVAELPFPPEAFDLVVVQCAPKSLDGVLPHLRPLLASDGRLALVVDGWPRELGLTAPLGLDAASNGAGVRSRIESTIASRPGRVGRRLEANGLVRERSYALLSRGTHENELSVPLGSADARRWLLRSFDGTAGLPGVGALDRLAALFDRTELVERSCPRYLHVCEPVPPGRSAGAVESASPDGNRDEALVALAGKHRTTVFELADGRLDRLRKVPNGRRQAVTNRRARDATETAATVESIEPTIPDAVARGGPFGPERVERPVRGRPLDRILGSGPTATERAIDAAYDWLERLQRGTRSRPERVTPADAAAELTADRFGLTDPPRLAGAIEPPRVLAHGDFFGSNIYVATGSNVPVQGLADSPGRERFGARAERSFQRVERGPRTGAERSFQRVERRRSSERTGPSTPGYAVSGVIDWEWARRDANPIVDGGFFALESAAHLAGDFEAGLDLLVSGESRPARALVDRLGDYGDAIGVESHALAAFLPIGYVERARRDAALAGRLDVDWPGRTRRVWDRHEALARRLSRTRRPR